MAPRPPVEARRLAALLPFGDRRRQGDRRHGDRRVSRALVGVERRRSVDRRHHLARRESSAGHVRQAVQVLELLAGQGELPPEARAAVGGVLRRLWLALREFELGNRGP